MSTITQKRVAVDSTGGQDTERPEGWASCELREVLLRLVDGSHNPPPKQDAGRTMLSARNIENNRLVKDEFRFISQSDFAVEDARTSVRPGDVLLTIVGSIGRSLVVPSDIEPFALQRSVAVMRPLLMNPKFMSYQFQAPIAQKFFEENAAGTAQKGVYLRTLGTMPVLISPIEEQHRIVVKIEQLLKSVNTGRERLAKVPEILKYFRQSVLAAACSGRLTADWRDAVATPVDMRKIRRPSGTKEPFQIPPSWNWENAGSFYDDACYGTSVKCDKSADSGMPVLRVPNIADAQLNLTDLKYASLRSAEIARLTLKLGDVLICRTNGSLDLIGKSAVIPDLPLPHAFASYLIRVRLDSNLLPEYFHIFLNAPIGRDQIEATARTTAGQFNLNLDILRALTIPLPPLEEQSEIIRRVEALFKLANAIEKRVSAAQARVDKLTQSILAKAFRGELVPTEAELARQEGREYEPASVLLDRIHKERKPASPRSRSKSAPAAS